MRMEAGQERVKEQTSTRLTARRTKQETEQRVKQGPSRRRTRKKENKNGNNFERGIRSPAKPANKPDDGDILGEGGMRGWWKAQRSRARLWVRPGGRAGGLLAACSPAEVEQRPGGGRSALCRPAEEVELRERACLLGLHVLKVKAPHQEVLAPDVLRHQVHLSGTRPALRAAAHALHSHPRPLAFPGCPKAKSFRKLKAVLVSVFRYFFSLPYILMAPGFIKVSTDAFSC